jgi:uncharacterized membrane protein
MEARAKVLGHAIHALTIVFPLGLLSTAVIFDLIHIFRGDTLSATVSLWVMGAGIIGGLVAAPFGWIDWTAIPSGTRAKTVGLTHGLVNMLVLAVFAVSFYLRWQAVNNDPGAIASIFSFAGFGLSLVGGWLGGELVERLGVAVHPGANADAPSSLTTKHLAPSRGTVRTDISK